MDNVENSISLLEESERMGQQVLQDKNEIIELNKRYNLNREALRAIQRAGKKKHFISIGGILVKTENQTCENIIREDQAKIDNQIKELRDGLRTKVNRLRDIEHQPPVPGLLLKPLSKEELNAVCQVMGGHAK